MKKLLTSLLVCFAVIPVQATTEVQKYKPTEERFWMFQGPGGHYGFHQSAGLRNDGRPYASSIVVLAQKPFFLPFRITTVGRVLAGFAVVGVALVGSRLIIRRCQ
jgi:hypothetical protein